MTRLELSHLKYRQFELFFQDCDPMLGVMLTWMRGDARHVRLALRDLKRR